MTRPRPSTWRRRARSAIAPRRCTSWARAAISPVSPSTNPGWPALAERVLRVTRAAYPDLRAIPNHTRFRHFDVGGIDRVARLDADLAARSASADRAPVREARAGDHQRPSRRRRGRTLVVSRARRRHLYALRRARRRQLPPVLDRRAVERPAACPVSRRRRRPGARRRGTSSPARFRSAPTTLWSASPGAPPSCAAWAKWSRGSPVLRGNGAAPRSSRHLSDLASAVGRAARRGRARGGAGSARRYLAGPRDLRRQESRRRLDASGRRPRPLSQALAVAHATRCASRSSRAGCGSPR